VNSARDDEISCGITTFHIVGCKTKMVLLVDVSDDQKGLGSILSITFCRHADGKMHMVFPLPSPSPLLNEMILHGTTHCKKHHLLLLYDWFLGLQFLSSD
jgi:hypothetical protein